MTVGLLPGPPALLCLLSAGCLLGLGSSPSGEASASSWWFSWRPGAADALAVALPEAASRREFFPLCLVLRLQGSVTFLAFVPQLVALSESLFPSLAPSWWWPCPLLRWALLTLSSYVLGVPSAVFFAVDPVALSPLLPHVFADGFRHWCPFRFCGGASPLAFGPVGPLGCCGGSTYIALHRAWLVSVILP